MDKRSILLWLGALISASVAAGQEPLAGSRPNIIFIFSDDHAPHAISAYGSKINATPNIDRLAAEGAIFRASYCGNSICGPSRATVLTGKLSHANGFMRNGNRFDGDQQTFPKLLQKAGYQTAMIGKWHLGTEPTGFDYWRILPGQGSYYNPDFIDADGRKRIEGYVTEITTELALDWLREGRDTSKPFLLMCQQKAPHRSWMPGPNELGLYRDVDIPEPPSLFDDYAGRGPAAGQQEMEIDRHMYMFYDLKLEPTPEESQNLKGPDRSWENPLKRMNAEQRAAWDVAYLEENQAFREAKLEGEDLIRWKYQRYIKNYLRCVAGVDRSVGQILDYLAESGLEENTIVIYSSDQGFYLGDHGWYDKRWMYEESFAMPLLARWPKHIPSGLEVTQLVQNIDYAPSFLERAGVEVPADMQGRSLLSLLAG
ncbi:MAG: sulfatase family protein, partial [Planctomycetota bacterium]